MENDDVDIFDPTKVKEALARVERANAAKGQIEKYLPILKEEKVLVDVTDENLLYANARVREAMAAENAARRRFIDWAARQDFAALQGADMSFVAALSGAMMDSLQGKPVSQSVRDKWKRTESAYLEMGRGFTEEIARRETKLPELQRIIDEESKTWFGAGMPVENKVTVKPPLRFKVPGAF